MRYSFVAVALMAGVGTCQQTGYGQCGGESWTGPKECIGGWSCKVQNQYYAQCLPGGATPPPAHPSPPPPPPPPAPTTKAAVPPPAPTSKPVPGGPGKVKYGHLHGIWCLPTTLPNGKDGIDQMQHFLKDDGMNIFRLPVGWQYLVDSPEATLNAAHFALYDKLVKGCLATGTTCIIDIHNYARWNGAIIGQGGPTDAQFANVWSQLAAKYANQDNIIFGIMNEPHDVPDINKWGATVQAAVNAIRNAGAKTQLILMPSNNWTSAANIVSSGSGAALLKVKNPDGSTSGLIFDVHKYLDSDSSGTNAECVTNNVDVFTSLASWLRSNKRQALLTETGGGNTASCKSDLCQQISYLNSNSDVYLGYIWWAAGNFDTSYVLSEVPTFDGTVWTDSSLLKACLAR